MKVSAIVEVWLKEHGFDGLCAPGGECACEVGDLFPCGEIHDDCSAGHKKFVKAGEECNCDLAGEDHWEIVVPEEKGESAGSDKSEKENE